MSVFCAESERDEKPIIEDIDNFFPLGAFVYRLLLNRLAARFRVFKTRHNVFEKMLLCLQMRFPDILLESIDIGQLWKKLFSARDEVEESAGIRVFLQNLLNRIELYS